MTIVISVQMLRKYAWTHGVLEIFLDGRSIFRTIEYAVSGMREATFLHEGRTHTLSLNWERPRIGKTSIGLSIDGEPLPRITVGVVGWPLAFVAPVAVGCVLGVGGALLRWATTNLR